MIAKLTHLFKELGVDPTAEEIADMLYLAKYIIPEQPGHKDKELPIKASPSDSDNQSRNKTKDTEKEPENEEVPIYNADTELDDTVGPEKVDIPFRVPAVTALHNQIAIERALRPLMRKIPSRNRFTLDENETFRQIAEMDNWNVVLKPEAARWLDAFIVVEESTSMNMWFQTIHELKILLERHGAFRDIQQWGFHIDTKTNNIHLHSGGYDKTQQTSRNPRELIHPSGNRLIIVISDCVSSAWYNGKMSEMMGQWTSHGIVIILQMLPYWFWERTGLSQAEILYMRAISPGMVNEKLVIDSFDMGSTISNISKFKFPVITIDSDSIGSWAKNISGKGGEWIPGIIMPPKNDNTDNHSDMNNTQNIDMTVEKRINLFKATASPTAKKLAAYFAAVPLNLHIMHLVQKVMLPNSNQVHFAEVFLSGLIKQQFTGESNIHPYEIKYDFIKGARERLISKSLVSETIQAISIFIEKYIGKPFDFNALLKNPSTVETLFKDKDMYNFANISFQVLKQLGGRYAKLADKIRHTNIIQGKEKKIKDKRLNVKMDLAKFFQLCNPGATLNVANSSDKNFYVDFSSVRPGNPIREIMRPITYSDKKPTCQLFTGHIGCGKTTELLRLKADLEAENYHVVFFESSQFLDMADVDISDILMLIARKIIESMKEAGLNIIPGYFKKLFQDINDLMASDVRLDKMEFALGLAKINTKSKESPTTRKKLRDYLESRTDNIVNAINEEVLIPVNEQLKTIDKKGLVVIVDNLDRIFNVIKTKRRTQPEYIFIDRGDQLQRLLCHLVYTIPLALTFSNDAQTLNSRYGIVPKILSMIPIKSRDGTYDKKSIALLKQMVLSRAFPELSLKERFNQIEQLFENKKIFTRICIASGGHVRNLLGLVYSCLRKADPPFTTEIYNEVIKEFRDDLVRKVEPHEWEMLKRVQEHQSVAGEKDYHTLHRSMFILEYQDRDGVWYHINPLLEGANQLK